MASLALRWGEQGGSDVAPPPHVAWTSALPEPAARYRRPTSEALDAPSLAGEEGGSEMQMSSRNEDDDNGEEEEVTKFAFNFSPKRDLSLSDEEQVETKRPKSPGSGEAGRAAGGAARRRELHESSADEED